MGKQYGQWEVVRSIDEGGQAHVFLVKDTKKELPGQYVLKRLKNHKRIDLFRQEVEAIRRVDHPHVLRVFGFNLNGMEPYYVAEYCERGSLAKQPERFRGDVAGALRVLLPIVDALRAAHAAGVVHRDVKPPNILFRGDGSPVLGDFGICHVEGSEHVTLSDEAMGSLNYIAPEMEAGRHGPVTGAVDVYAIGKVQYYMLSGGHIFAREGHRAPGLYLPERLGRQKWEHMHSLFDKLIVENPTGRLPIDLLSSQLQEAHNLVEGDFTPLRPSMGLRCRFCGIGTYERYARALGRSPGWFYSLVQRGGVNIAILRCGHCAHVEWFDFSNIKEDWWDR